MSNKQSIPMTITPKARADFLVQFLLGDNEENQKFAREQILALCQFFEENPPEEEEDKTDE